MKKLLSFIFVLLVSICVASAASAYTIAWDYTNPAVGDEGHADGFRLYSSIDKNTWTPMVTFNGDVTSGLLPYHTSDDQRVFYRLTAYNGDGESEPSNITSFYWKTGDGTAGGSTGWSGPQAPGGLKIVDCDKPGQTDPICQSSAAVQPGQEFIQ